MTRVNVTFIGKENSGKSYLINRLRTNTFAPESITNTAVSYLIAQKGSTKLQLWDIKGKHLSLLAEAYLKDCNSCIYTIDLSVPLNEEELASDMAMIRKTAPDTILILAGCKNDLEQKIGAQQLLALQAKYNIDHVFSTSSRTGEGVEELCSLVAYQAPVQKIQKSIAEHKPDFFENYTLDEIKRLLDKSGPLYQAIENLERLTRDLNESHRNIINNAIVVLITKIHDPDKDKSKAIEKFVQTCNEVLQDATRLGFNKETLAKVSNGVLVLAAASAVTVIATSVFFGFGLATIVLGGTLGIATAYLLVKRGLFASSFKASLEGINNAASSDEQENFRQIVSVA